MRVLNVTGDDVCGRCEMAGTPKQHVESGLIVVAYRDDGTARVPEYAPCPFCERGYAKEFPKSDRDQTWPGGYWRGREADVEPPLGKGALLSREENGMRLLLLMRRLNHEDVDPAVGLEPLLPERERLALLMDLTT